MSKTISVELSGKSIKQAIRELDKYKKELERKNEEFVTKLAEIGVDVIRTTMQSVPEEFQPGTWDADKSVRKNKSTAKATVYLEGDRVLFIEFGAGIRYVNSQHPEATRLGYGSGTYPGQTHVPDPGYWYYKDEATGESVKSYGNQNYMPVYHASTAIILEIQRIAREVFNT